MVSFVLIHMKSKDSTSLVLYGIAIDLSFEVYMNLLCRFSRSSFVGLII